MFAPIFGHPATTTPLRQKFGPRDVENGKIGAHPVSVIINRDARWEGDMDDDPMRWENG